MNETGVLRLVKEDKSDTDSSLCIALQQITALTSPITKINDEWKHGRSPQMMKTQKSDKPELFRPITVSSLWIRLLNKILSAKITRTIFLRPEHLEFEKLDGTAIGCFLSC